MAAWENRMDTDRWGEKCSGHMFCRTLMEFNLGNTFMHTIKTDNTCNKINKNTTCSDSASRNISKHLIAQRSILWPINCFFPAHKLTSKCSGFSTWQHAGTTFIPSDANTFSLAEKSSEISQGRTKCYQVSHATGGIAPKTLWRMIFFAHN